MSTKKNKLDMALMEVMKRFISIKDEESKRSQAVFETVFKQVKRKMEEKCNFFKTYSSQVMFGGSVTDGIKVSKLDEIDMDIVIRLPINYDQGPDGITIENDQPGFVKMKIANAFDNLDKQQHWESRHKVTREWRDSDNYFLQNKFRNWLQGVIQKAINDMNMQAEVEGVRYLLTYKESGPAYTLNIRNDVGNEPFALDVDIVPVIKFQTPRWPSGYTSVEGISARDWFVVPKPNKYSTDNKVRNRCWRLSFQDFEKELIKGCQNLKNTIRLVKKLRDALGMKAIASYYIKTLFLWQVTKRNKSYWQNNLSLLFRDMVKGLYDALNDKNIPYFWHKENNLIGNLKSTLMVIYADKLKGVLDAIATNDIKAIITAILTIEERTEFIKCEFYLREFAEPESLGSGIYVKLWKEIIILKGELEGQRNKKHADDVFKLLEAKVIDLSDRLDVIEDRVKRLEIEMCKNATNNMDGLRIGNGMGNSDAVNSNTITAEAPKNYHLQKFDAAGCCPQSPSSLPNPTCLSSPGGLVVIERLGSPISLPRKPVLRETQRPIDFGPRSKVPSTPTLQDEFSQTNAFVNQSNQCTLM